MNKTIMLLVTIFVLLMATVFVYSVDERTDTPVVTKTGESVSVTANSGVNTIAVVQDNAIEVTAEVL